MSISVVLVLSFLAWCVPLIIRINKQEIREATQKECLLYHTPKECKVTITHKLWSTCIRSHLPKDCGKLPY